MSTDQKETGNNLTPPIPPSLSTPRPLPSHPSQLNRYGSVCHASSPLASLKPIKLDLSLENGTIHARRQNSSRFVKSSFFASQLHSLASRSEESSTETGDELGETALGIQAGKIGGGFGPYPSSSILTASATSTCNQRVLHSHGSDSAIDLFASPFPQAPTAFPSPPLIPTASHLHTSHTTYSTTNSLPHLPNSSGESTPTQSNPFPRSLPISPLYLNDHKFLDTSENDEYDDFLYSTNPSARRRYKQSWRRKTFFEYLNAFALFSIVAALLVLMLVYPVVRYGVVGTWTTPHRGGSKILGWNLSGINASGQVPKVVIPGLIDLDTPQNARTRVGFDGETYNLVFSDEFNQDGRTFWPGDDPFWEAVDLHYWQTQDYEWYDPDAIITKDGKLEITLSQEPIHDLNFRSGMLQSWNKLCFQGGIIEVSMSAPGDSKTMGFWPGVWTLGNLGRAGFGASNDGVWPYSYNSCDVGTLPNQTFSNHTPTAAHTSGLSDYGGQLSWLRGQRLSSCTCEGEDHPGPDVSVGRGAPEIDLTEQQVDWRGTGSTSQSIQFAPMDAGYQWLNTTPHTTLFNPDRTFQNLFQGATFQESASVITLTDTTSYDGKGYTRYGFEYEPGSNGQITWFVNDTASWRILASALGPNEETGISQRLISEEPMSININLAISKAFQTPNWANLTFPGVLRIDYIRVYQKGPPKVGCDPADHPTSDYINRHMDIYTNPNLTTFPGTFPRNRISDEGCK
ncbi:hypothetical protein JCM5350_008308 [Sporobolomyces pararoseus]